MVDLYAHWGDSQDLVQGMKIRFNHLIGKAFDGIGIGFGVAIGTIIGTYLAKIYVPKPKY